jgi:predicted nucleotidyltransferase
MTIQTIKKKIVPILRRQGVTKAALFGSAAKRKTGKIGDIDLLIKIRRDKSLLDILHLKLELEEKLGKKVDLVEYAVIKPFFRDIILKEQKIIYEKKRS